jgi:hypothetical protein
MWQNLYLQQAPSVLVTDPNRAHFQLKEHPVLQPLTSSINYSAATPPPSRLQQQGWWTCLLAYAGCTFTFNECVFLCNVVLVSVSINCLCCTAGFFLRQLTQWNEPSPGQFCVKR